MGDLDTHGCGQAISHRAEAARGHPAVRLLELEELGGPHLVLTDLRGDVDIPVAGQRIEALDRMLRLDQIAPAAVVTQAIARSPRLDGTPPLVSRRAVAAAAQRGGSSGQNG